MDVRAHFWALSVSTVRLYHTVLFTIAFGEFFKLGSVNIACLFFFLNLLLAIKDLFSVEF